MKIAGVVLAAGASSRLGRPKQSIRFGLYTLLERTIRIAGMAGLEPVFVVLSPDGVFEINVSATILINKDAAEGMASSIRTGVASAEAAGADGVIIMASDQPGVAVEHLNRLAGGGEEIVASAYAGRKGVPAYFPARMFSALMELRGDTGAREMLRDAKAIPLEHGELDIDTMEDLELARRLYPEMQA